MTTDEQDLRERAISASIQRARRGLPQFQHEVGMWARQGGWLVRHEPPTPITLRLTGATAHNYGNAGWPGTLLASGDRPGRPGGVIVVLLLATPGRSASGMELLWMRELDAGGADCMILYPDELPALISRLCGPMQ